MPNRPTDERPRRRVQRRGGTGDNAKPRRQQSRGGRQGVPAGAGRLSREELEWARDLWQHREPPEEIAHQLGVEVAQVEALISAWQEPKSSE